MLRAHSSTALLLVSFLSCTNGEAFFGFKKIPKLQEPLLARNPVEATNPVKLTNPVLASYHEAHQVQKPQLRRIVKKVKANEEQLKEVGRSLKAAIVAPIDANDQRKAATRTLGDIVSANVQSTVADKHLEFVAKSMKTVVDSKIQNSNHGFFRRPQSHQPRGIKSKVIVKVDNISKPVSKSIKLEVEDVSSHEDLSKEVDHSLASVAKSMKAVVDKVESPHKGQSVIQGFKVQGDSSNKIVFLDLEALKSSGLSLDSSRISLGSSGFGQNLQPIEGLEAKSPIQSIVEQKPEAYHEVANAESQHQSLHSQPAVAVKHVSASQPVSGGSPVSLGSRVTVSTGEAEVIRPQSSSGTAQQRKSLFFGKFEGRNSGKPSTSNHNRASSTATVFHQDTEEGSQPVQQVVLEVHHPHQQVDRYGFGGF